MSTATRFRCHCGYEATEQARPGHDLVAVYHMHPGIRGWGPITVRMEPVAQASLAKVPAKREMAIVA